MNDSRTDGSFCAETVPAKGLTLGALIEQYKTDRISGYQKLRYHTRVNHDSLMDRMVNDYGDRPIADIRLRTIEEMYLHWSADGTKIPMGHMFLSKLRTICSYGAGMLEDMECNRICIALSKRKYAMAEKAKETFLTAAQADAICEKAREYGFYSIAVGQSLQFECVLRQRDVYGEWVPLSEPGESDIRHRGWKWIRGIRWPEIDSDLVLRHVTSKRQKKLIVPLTKAPMVMRELDLMPSFMKAGNGAVIICEATALPWKASELRRKWRMIADACGIPKEIKNMDSRSGGLSEGSDAGIPLEHLRHAATHSDISTTIRYSRNSAQKVAEVLDRRVAYRQSLQGEK